MEILVEVEFVIVPLATLIEGRVRLVTERFVIVAEVKVALPPKIFALAMLAVAIFDVVEFVVDALIV